MKNLSWFGCAFLKQGNISFVGSQDQPQKKFYFPQSLPCCDGMKRNTLEKLLHVLQTGENEIEVSDALREAALKPLEKMLELAR